MTLLQPPAVAGAPACPNQKGLGSVSVAPGLLLSVLLSCFGRQAALQPCLALLLICSRLLVFDIRPLFPTSYPWA